VWCSVAWLTFAASVSAWAAPAAAPAPIFVLNSLDATISLINPATYTEIKRLPTGKEPHHLYLSPDERSLIVANALSDSLTLVDPKTGEIQRTITGIVDPYQLRFSPDMKWFITAGNRLDHVAIYKVNSKPEAGPAGFDITLVKRIPAGKTPSHIFIDTKSTTAYVSLQDSDELISIDIPTQSVHWKVPVGKTPADVYLTPDDKHLLVALTGDSFVEVYDVSGAQPKLVKRIKTGDGAHSFRAWGDKRHVLVSNRAGNTISRIDMQTFTVVDQYAAPGGPDDMDVLSDGKTLIYASRWARKLGVIDTSTKKIVHMVPVGRSPHGVWTLDHAPRQ
jgi:DNA-binding beta-propeller fold protein YncE